MDALYYVVISLFVIVCIMLVGIILLQSSQTGGMGSAIAGNSAFNTAFGGQGADKLLVRITTVLAALFMLLAISLNVLSTPGSSNTRTVNERAIMEKNKSDVVIPVPVQNTDDSNQLDSTE